MDKDLMFLDEFFVTTIQCSPMVVLELRSPHGCFQERLKSAGKVDKTVTHEEEHTEEGSQGVHVADEYCNLDNCNG